MPVFTDARGTLISVEFDSLPFWPQRCFVVVAPGSPARRGGHEAGCRQVLLLLHGAVTLRLGRGDGRTEHRLVETGSSVLIAADDFVDYELETLDTQVLVLAEHAYTARST